MTFRQELRETVKKGSITEMMEYVDRILEEEYWQQNRDPNLTRKDWEKINDY